LPTVRDAKTLHWLCGKEANPKFSYISGKIGSWIKFRFLGCTKLFADFNGLTGVAWSRAKNSSNQNSPNAPDFPIPAFSHPAPGVM